MSFCTKCGSRLVEASARHACPAKTFSEPCFGAVPEHALSGDLPPLIFAYSEPAFFRLTDRRRELQLFFSYISGVAVSVRRYEDALNQVSMTLWSQPDDPIKGPQVPIIVRERQPRIRTVVGLKLGSGAERSIVLAQVKFAPAPGSRITLIFPVVAARALNPIYDYAALAAVNYETGEQTWSTAHPEVHQLWESLPTQQSRRFGGALANHLEGLCRRCFRLLNPHKGRTWIQNALLR